MDPGSEDFWNRVTLKKYKKEFKEVALEIREERVLFTVEQANTILEKLFRAGEWHIEGCRCVVCRRERETRKMAEERERENERERERERDPCVELLTVSLR